jgi:lipid A 4'-phosphatase
MHYLSMKRTRIFLASFALFAVVVTTFPAIDLYIAGYFFRANSFARDQWWQTAAHNGLNYFLIITFGGVLALYGYNRVFKKNVWNVNGRKVLFLLLVLAIGAGLIVNVLLKDNFGRARPRDIAEFGGQKIFTPAFVVSHECRTNCSFSSGDSAGAFYALALVMALRRRRTLFLAAFAFGALVSLGRISSGAHFFSDTMTSFFVMLIVSDVLYYYVVLDGSGREKARALNSGLTPAYALRRGDLEVAVDHRPEHLRP